MWDALVESAQHYGGGPVGTEAMEISIQPSAVSSQRSAG